MADVFIARVNYLTFDIFGTVMDLSDSLAGPAGAVPGGPRLRYDGPSVLRRVAGTAAH